MKSTPILFRPFLAEATLDKRKTLTQRTRGLDKLNEIPDDWIVDYPTGYDSCEPGLWFSAQSKQGSLEWVGQCPYGQPGDEIWVRESYFAWGMWFPLPLKEDKWFFNHSDTEPPLYLQELPHDKPRATKESSYGYAKRPSIHMLREHSRITVEITKIELRRLHNMRERDAEREGVEQDPEFPNYFRYYGKSTVFGEKSYQWESAIHSYMTLWDSINGKRKPGKPDLSWDANPWVWAVYYKLKEVEK